MALFINLFQTDPGSALAEDCQAGDGSIPLMLPEQDARVIEHLLACESYAVSRAIAAVFLAGCREATRSSRGRLQPGS